MQKEREGFLPKKSKMHMDFCTCENNIIVNYRSYLLFLFHSFHVLEKRWELIAPTHCTYIVQLHSLEHGV